MRSFFFNLLLAAALTLLVISGVQVYHRFLQPDPMEMLMDKYGAPSAGDPSVIRYEWDDLIKRAEAQQNQLR